MTPLPARVAEAWREERMRYWCETADKPLDETATWAVTASGSHEPVFTGTASACDAYIDEQCGRAVVRVVLDWIEASKERTFEAADARVRWDPEERMVCGDFWLVAIAAWREEMGL